MSRAAMTLATLAVVLTGLVMTELIIPVGNNGDEPAGLKTPQINSQVASASNSATGLVAAILARPLFRSDRKPAPGDTRGMTSGAPADLPRLTGILMTDNERRAIFQPAGKERPIVVVEGETVGNWRVDQIAVDAVILSGPGGTRRIEPRFSGAAPTGAPQQTTPPVAGFGNPGGQQNGGQDRLQGKH
jgi:hypothetical protein